MFWDGLPGSIINLDFQELYIHATRIVMSLTIVMSL